MKRSPSLSNQSLIDRLPVAWRWVAIAAGFSGCLLVDLLFEPSTGPIGDLILFLPAALAALLFGRWAGLLATLAALGLSMGLTRLHAPPGSFPISVYYPALVAAPLTALGSWLIGFHTARRRRSRKELTTLSNIQEALRQSDRRYRALFNESQTPMLVVDPAGLKFMDANEAACQFYGRPFEEIIGSPISDITGEPSATLLSIEQAVKEGNCQPFRSVHLTAGGAARDVEIIINPLDFSGNRMYYLIVQDVSERRRIEQGGQEQRMLAEALRDTAQVLTSALQFEEVLERILANVGRVVPHDTASMLLVTPNGRITRVLSGQGFSEPSRREFLRRLVGADLHHPFLQPIAATRDVLLLSDARDWTRPIEAAWINSFLSAPVYVQGSLAGFIHLTSATPHYFTPTHADRLRAFADQAAIAIHNANLYEEARQQALNLSRSNSVLAAINRVALHLFQSAPDAVLNSLVTELRELGISCAIALLDDANDCFVAYYSTIRVEASVGKITLPANLPRFELSLQNFAYYPELLAGRSVFVENVDGLLAILLEKIPPQSAQELVALAQINERTHSIFTPLLIEERPTGILALWSENMEEEDLPTATVLARQAALALHNANLYAEVQHQAITDFLTGLYNRRGLVELGRREVERAQRFGRPLTAIMADIDFFKNFNDCYSYQVGDQVLQELAHRLRRTIRDVDLAARFGGEEFILLIVENDLEASRAVAERLRQSVSDLPFQTTSGPLRVTISLGLAGLSAETVDLDGLIFQAGEALHLAKQHGRNRVEVVQAH